MLSSRTRHLEGELATLQYHESLKAFDLVIEEMCKEKGFVRHNDTHYYHHLVDVAQHLLNHGIRDQDIITAALLHDLVEDVEGYTVEWIAEHFNENVARMVALVTKPRDFDKTNPAHFQEYLGPIYDEVGPCLIKTSDQTHNFFTLLNATDEKKLRKVHEMETYYIPFFKNCRERYRRHKNIFFEAKTKIEYHLVQIRYQLEEKEALLREIQKLREQIQKSDNQ
ncbi:HD domain-containing protein (plasmid) [Pontibacillus sp. ALD_SL1]|uniref:HD domain-containing protein n=1 Tax=Pontibacillus sp. ALD_SL1 TaxID=2777185 RepID=UPI001A9576CB|nr:HD domain-containing protein [Pontibacillus sp. ALD_SL1]QST02775.1 HD domain-containing protein [Pontibacillus sp. ALD_SL1]